MGSSPVWPFPLPLAGASSQRLLVDGYYWGNSLHGVIWTSPNVSVPWP